MSTRPAHESGAETHTARAAEIGRRPRSSADSSLLIGRDRELADLTALIGDPATRVITVTGPGGAGKTLLSLELARISADRFDDGAIFVPLGDVGDPRHVASEISRALGLVAATGVHPTDRLVAGLRIQHLLLVLDGFEHLVAAAPLVSELATRCKRLVVLVTSRRRLGIAGERVIDVGGLELPGPHVTIGTQRIEDVPAVQLFVKRAAAVNSRFAPDATTLAAIGELCRLVDGLPLAIELMASYVRVLSVEALIERLGERGDTLGLDAAIAWSYELLDATAAVLLPHLGVFHEGCTLDAIEAVCNDAQVGAGLLDALVELIDLHLVEPLGEADGELRFCLLETVRRFACERLGRDPAADELQDRHAEYYQRLSVRCGADFESPRAVSAIGELHRELPNIRAALAHLERRGRWAKGLEAVLALCPYWTDHGPVSEARHWLRRFAHGPDLPAALAAKADAWDAYLEFTESLDITSDEVLDEGLDVALERLRVARETMAAAGDWHGWARAGYHAAMIGPMAGRFEATEPLVEELLTRSPEPETTWIKVELLHLWAGFLRERGFRERALAATEESIELARSIRHERLLTRALSTYATFATDLAAARSELEGVFSIAVDIGDRRGATLTSAIAGLLALADGESEAAANWFLRTIDIGLSIGSALAVARGVSGIVCVAALERRWVDAARMHGAYMPRSQRLQRTHPPEANQLYQSLVDTVASNLAGDFYEQCRAGFEQGWDAAVDLARNLARELTRDHQPRHPSRRRGPRANPELTDRELDVLAELVAGHTNQQIGSSLGISAKTVMHHTMNVYRKLGVRGRAEAVAHALRSGLVDA